MLLCIKTFEIRYDRLHLQIITTIARLDKHFYSFFLCYADLTDLKHFRPFFPNSVALTGVKNAESCFWGPPSVIVKPANVVWNVVIFPAIYTVYVLTHGLLKIC